MTWWQVEELARFGVAVRRTAWPTNKSVTYSAGRGTTRAVAVLREGPTETIITADQFGAAEYQADDWQPA